METLLLIAFVVVALGLIGLVLIQHGKGADAGAAFGSGASATVFGAGGSGSFLSRATAILATIFFILSLVLANISGKSSRQASVTETAAPAVVQEAPTPVADLPADVPVPAAAEAQESAPATDIPAAPAPADVPGTEAPKTE